MQITINVPDNLPISFVQKEIHEFEERLKKIKVRPNELSSNDEFKIDVQACLEAFEKIQCGDKSGLTEIGDIDEYIESLKNEISQD